MTFISPFTVDFVFDLATLSFIAALLLLSLVSLFFIFYLHLKSRSLQHLQRFNTLWTVRILLVSFVFLWAINELLALPLFRRRHLEFFLPDLTIPQQVDLCNVRVVLSLGFLQPGFLVTLLFLVDVSIKKKIPRGAFAFTFVIATCFPILFLQVFSVFFSKFEMHLPEFFLRSAVICKIIPGSETVLCAYPFLTTALFAAFATLYLLSFLLSCWKVESLVINKALRLRISILAFTVTVTLPAQVLFMGLSVLWTPDHAAYGGFALLVFLSVFACAVTGEGILVIRPVADSLAAGGETSGWTGGLRPQATEEVANLV